MTVWKSTPRSCHDLSPRQLEALALVAEGCTNAEIGARMWTTEHTARRHVVNIFAKLGARSRAHCVHLAYQRGLLKPVPGAGGQP